MRRNALLGLVIFCAIGGASVSAAQDPEILAQEAASGADAANPTAAVNFQDLRYRYFDLDQGADKHSFETKVPISCTRVSNSPMNCLNSRAHAAWHWQLPFPTSPEHAVNGFQQRRQRSCRDGPAIPLGSSAHESSV